MTPWNETEVARLREEFDLERDAEERRLKEERFGAPAIFGPTCLDCNVPVERTETGFWRHLAFEGACGRAVVVVTEVVR